MTGSSVCAATTPGSAAASPAPQIRTRRPRSRAERAYSATASGVRCAERTSNSHPMPCSSSTSIAPCIRSLSDSEPTRMPTLTSATCDVLAVAHAGEMYAVDGAVCGGTCSCHRLAAADDVQDSAAVRDGAAVLERRAGVKDERAGRLGLGDALDRR